ncbi:hypothetical protein M0802_015727 [Mischocyttarus mexicanus]|nr:hypothetical protein M0802_015727 [Mischocyttarus mexicanus]
MKSVLRLNKLWEYVAGLIEKTEDNEKEWSDRDVCAFDYIVLSVQSDQHSYIKNAKTSKEAWEKLQNVHHQPSSWCLDSGATRHISNEKNKFVNLNTNNTPVCTATEDCILASGSGVVKFETLGLKNEVIQIQLSNTLFVPGIKRNLLSVSTMVQHGYKVVFNKQGAIVKRQDGKIIMKATLRDGLYIINEKKKESVMTTYTPSQNLIK